MVRIRVGGLMFLVGLVAINIASLRFLLPPSTMPFLLWTLLAGLLPLADAFLVGAYAVVSHYRASLVRRDPQQRARFAPAFVVCCGIFLWATLAVCLCVPESYEYYPTWAAQPVDHYLAWLGVPTTTETPVLRYAIRPMFLGVILSGPPLVMAVASAFVLSRFMLVVTPRADRGKAA
jgi:hypothetical protein